MSHNDHVFNNEQAKLYEKIMDAISDQKLADIMVVVPLINHIVMTTLVDAAKKDHE